MTKINIKGAASGGGGGGVTAVAVAAGNSGTDVNITGSPITSSGTITVNIPTASNSNTGKLSSSDWAAFNAKQPALVSGTNIKTINGNSILGSGDLVVTVLVGGDNGEIQYNNGGTLSGALDVVWNDITNQLGVGTASPTKKLTVYDVANQCAALFESGQNGGGVAFMDISTTNADQVGVGAFGNLLCLRGGGNAGGTVRISDTYVDCRGNELYNFVPLVFTGAALVVSSSNQDVYCGGVYEVTGAVNITIDDSVRDGFSMSVIQMDANQCTIIAGGTLTLRNRQGHTQSAGQWATLSLFKNGSNLILAGDTA